jgi:hypothetical protein
MGVKTSKSTIYCTEIASNWLEKQKMYNILINNHLFCNEMFVCFLISIL